MTTVPWPSTNTSTCQHCGAHVTDRFGRVFGDDHDVAHRCPDHLHIRHVGDGEWTLELVEVIET